MTDTSTSPQVTRNHTPLGLATGAPHAAVRLVFSPALSLILAILLAASAILLAT
jgi:hypothetical protein